MAMQRLFAKNYPTEDALAVPRAERKLETVMEA